MSLFRGGSSKPVERFAYGSSSRGIAALLYEKNAAASEGESVAHRFTATSLSSISTSARPYVADVPEVLQPGNPHWILAHMARSGSTTNTGCNSNEFGQQATAGIQIGENLISNVINVSQNLDVEESYYCSMKTASSDMSGGVLHISKMKLEFRPYVEAEFKKVMPLHQVNAIKPLTHGGHKIIQIRLLNGDVNEFLSFGNFDGALRRLLEAKPHPYLSFPSVKTMVEEDYCQKGYFSEIIAKEDLMSYRGGIQIRESYKCSHDSYLGQIKGTIYITSTTFEFCSDDPVSFYNSRGGGQAQQGCYYKLVIPIGQFREMQCHGPPRDHMDSVPSWQYGCMQIPNITIFARPFKQTDIYDFNFKAIQEFWKCYDGLEAVLNAIHKKKDGKCCH